MRVTDKQMFNTTSAGIGHSRERVSNAANQVSTGIRVEHPWDGPTEAGIIVAHGLAARRAEAIAQTVRRASSELQAADGALGEIGNLLIRAKEIAVQFANATYTAGQRASAESEVAALHDQIVARLNTEVGGRYVFGGTRDRDPPFQLDGTYIGDTAIRQVEISPGLTEDSSIRADVTFKGVGGGVDTLTALQDFSVALLNNDVPGLQTTLGNLDAAIAQLATARTQTGVLMSVLDTAAGVNEELYDRERLVVGEAQDADLFEASSEMALSQRALEAAISATSQSLRLTLLDKI